jgi:hypothetical protein
MLFVIAFVLVCKTSVPFSYEATESIIKRRRDDSLSSAW